MSSRPDSPFQFVANGTIRLDLAPQFTSKLAEYRLTKLTYDYTFAAKDDAGAEVKCAGKLEHVASGSTNGMSVVLDSTNYTPPDFYSLTLRGNVLVCDGVSIGRLVWPDDAESVLTDRTYRFGTDLVGSSTNPVRDLPWTWKLSPIQ